MEAVAAGHISAARELSSEADLVRAAARGDERAFGDLYRRHGQTGWRLAQAVALTPSDAAGAFTEGFSRALRAVRHRQVPASQPFRPLLLAGVYRSASDALHRSDEPMTLPLGGRRGEAGAARLLGAAFWSLPDRWRAALWLAEVEGLNPERIAPILMVSSAVASQLVARGRAGLADRFRQADQPLPDLLGPALRPLVIALPAGMAAAALAVEKTSRAADPARRFEPATGWLSERMTRPLSMAIGGILALGLVGAGVVGQPANLASFGPSAAGGGPNPSSTLGVKNAAGQPKTLRSSGGGSSLLFGPGGVAAQTSLISSTGGLGSGSFGGGAATSLSGAGSGGPSGTSASPGGGGSGPSAGGGSSPTSDGGSSPTGSGAGGSGGSGGSSGSGSAGSNPTTTTIPPVTTISPVTLPPTTLPPVTLPPVSVGPIAVGGGNGVTITVPGVIGVTLGGTTTTTTVPKATTTTTAPKATTTTAPTTTCTLNLLGLCIPGV